MISYQVLRHWQDIDNLNASFVRGSCQLTRTGVVPLLCASSGVIIYTSSTFPPVNLTQHVSISVEYLDESLGKCVHL